MESALPQLNKYNELLNETIGELGTNQENLQNQIDKAASEEQSLSNRIDEIEARLEYLKNSIKHKSEVRDEYDVAIAETYNAYTKIIQSSNSLLGVLRRECVNLARDALDD